jgi:hypothetical protein
MDPHTGVLPQMLAAHQAEGGIRGHGGQKNRWPKTETEKTETEPEKTETEITDKILGRKFYRPN